MSLAIERRDAFHTCWRYECLAGSLPFFSQSQDRRRAFQELKTQIINGTNLPHRLSRMQKKQRDVGADPKECLAASQFISKAGRKTLIFREQAC